MSCHPRSGWRSLRRRCKTVHPIRPSGRRLWSHARSSAEWRNPPIAAGRASNRALLPSTYPRPLFQQVKETLFDFFQLGLEADLRAAHFRLQRAFTVLQRGVSDQFRRRDAAARLRKMFIPEVHVRGICAQPHVRARIEFFQCHMNQPRQQQRIDLRFAMQNLSRNGQSQLHNLRLDADEILFAFLLKLRERSANSLLNRRHFGVEGDPGAGFTVLEAARKRFPVPFFDLGFRGGAKHTPGISLLLPTRFAGVAAWRVQKWFSLHHASAPRYRFRQHRNLPAPASAPACLLPRGGAPPKQSPVWRHGRLANAPAPALPYLLSTSPRREK